MIKYSPNAGIWMKNELYFSKAYQGLTISARNLFHCLMQELRWKGKSKNREFTNNGEVSFTEVQFKELFKSSSSTYIKARNQLIGVGLIDQTYRGGNCRGDRATYKILALTGLPTIQERWRQYPSKNWEHKIPKAKNNLVGRETRWKKGQSGRQTNSTL